MLTRMRARARAWMAELPLPRAPALRRAGDPGWTLATDLPALADAEVLGIFLRRAEAAGWRTGLAGNGWLLLDAPGELPRAPLPDPLPPGERGAALSLLARHPGPETDADALRAIAKAAEQGPAALERCCAELHARWAVALRRGEPLPAALLPFLSAACQPETKKSEEETP